MKISILLPYKENFSPEYPGAVSLFVYETTKLSKYKKFITVYGSTNYKEKFNVKYINIELPKKILTSNSKNYINSFILKERKVKSDLIEIHNRPNYLNFLYGKLNKRNYSIFFHNDPLSMDGSKTIEERKILLKRCYRIIFNSNWSRKRFLEGLSDNTINSEKLLVFYQSARKQNNDIVKKKKKWITFVGKLNKAKGYDIFAKAIIKVLNKNTGWECKVVGDEKREKIELKHDKVELLGFKKHNYVLRLFKKTSIAVVCSRWEEPFGRTSLEASANGCAVIISNKGGLPETATNPLILNELSVEELTDKINYLINNNSLRKNLQTLSIKNFFLTHKYVTGLIDEYRQKKLSNIGIFNIKIDKPLRILHITNFNERLDGRLFFNTGRRINNGFIRLGHSVLGFSDRDILRYYKSYNDFTGSKSLNDKLKKTCYNYKPDLIVMGHSDLVNAQQLSELKDDYPDIKIAQWFLDPLNKNGPDYVRNKQRILDKIEFTDANFITTDPRVLSFLPSNKKNFFIPNPVDSSFEILNNFEKNDCNKDVFFALSHGVHRGVLKEGKDDDRNLFLKELIKISSGIRFDIYGINNIQPIWADNYLKAISNAKMGLNLSRGTPIKYYSSDRLAQIVGNGLVTLIDEKTCYSDFFTNKEMVFYKDISDLSEKILKISKDDRLRKSIARAGKIKYTKYFNSTSVAKYIINKSFDINRKDNFLWEK